jgi:hypothetical protein
VLPGGGGARAPPPPPPPPLVLLQTVVPAVVGLAFFGDQVRAGWWPVACVGFVLSIAGALVLSGAETRLQRLEQPEPGGVTEHQPG